MALALRGSAVASAGNPTTGFNLTVDANIQADDLLFLALTSRDSTDAGTLAVTDNDTGGNAWAVLGNSTDYKATVWWKRATALTASKTVTVANAVGSACGVMKGFSGGDTGATPYSDFAVEDNASGDEGHAGFTPSQADSMVCAVVFNLDNISIASPNFATLGAVTNTHAESGGGADSAVDFGHVLETGGPVATGNFGWNQGNLATKSVVWTIKPAGGGGGGGHIHRKVSLTPLFSKIDGGLAV